MTNRSSLRCPKCGEEAEPGFTACWKCRTPLPVPVALIVADPPEDDAAEAAAEAASGTAPPPRSTPPRAARPPKRIQVALGFILVALHLALIIDGAARNQPEVGGIAGGAMIMFGGPGSLMIYFGLRTRYLQRVTDNRERMDGIARASLGWVLPGYIALTLSVLLGAGWGWGLTAAIVGVGLAGLIGGNVESVARRAWDNQLSVERSRRGKLDHIDRGQLSPHLRFWVVAGDINRLGREFIRSVRWEEREEVVAAFWVLCRALRDRHVDRSGELIPVLNEILARCYTAPGADSDGENCIEYLELLLVSLKKGAV